jgi:hypothetical protein
VYCTVGASLRYESQMTLRAESKLEAYFAQLKQLHPDRQTLDYILHLTYKLIYLRAYLLLSSGKEVLNSPILLVCSQRSCYRAMPFSLS